MIGNDARFLDARCGMLLLEDSDYDSVIAVLELS